MWEKNRIKVRKVGTGLEINLWVGMKDNVFAYCRWSPEL